MNFKLLLTSTLLAGSLAGTAQTNRNVGYAFTGDGNNDFLWMNIRQVDLSTGSITKTLFERSKTAYQLSDVTAKKSYSQTENNENIFVARTYPTGTFVAAAALDAKGSRLFFTPMRLPELRWVDLNADGTSPQFYTLPSDVLKFGDPNDEAHHLTRMTIGADGNGYAMTNDGNHLIRFTTGKKPSITDLGPVVDAENSGGMSIHNKCSSWGGDMLADAFGKLYVISAGKHVFVIEPSTRIATYKGAISSLPAAYTVNAAAVNSDGDIIVTSANFFEGYYKVKLSDLSAVKMEGSDIKYNASDLASSNLLLEKEYAQSTKFNITTPDAKAIMNNADSKIFPNPINGNSFSILLDGQKEGRYSVILSDLQGRIFQTKSFTINKSAQTEQISIVNRPVKGIYMVRVINANNQAVITEKIVLE